MRGRRAPQGASGAPGAPPPQPDGAFGWPDGKRAAVSLSFDDARESQIDVGLPLFDRYGVNASFFVGPSAVERRRKDWKKAVAAGHEIGNHSVHHPCSGNFAWARPHALEDYTLPQMRAELIEANRHIEALVGVTAVTFAYPCGQTFVGRGTETRSYVPLVAELFLAGRGWLDEGPNDPAFCDLAQLTGIEMDGKEFEQLLPLLSKARETGQWVVLGGHEIGARDKHSTSAAMLDRLMEYAGDDANGLWVAPIGTVAAHVRQQRLNTVSV